MINDLQTGPGSITESDRIYWMNMPMTRSPDYLN